MFQGLVSNSILKDRAHMMRTIRLFFQDRNVMEVDTPILGVAASVSAEIDLIEARCCGEICFLDSSPEFKMKKLLAAGSGDIYQLAHVFRDGEVGRRHNPEFLMAEWYRIGYSAKQMIQETLDFIRLFLQDLNKVDFFTYEELFDKYVGFFPENLEERDRIFVEKIQHTLGSDNTVVVVFGFPKEQAALAKISEINGKLQAERFEIFINGLELANGFHELTNSKEQLERLEEANQIRAELNKKTYPIDTDFIKAVELLPECSGVSVGIDRLMMIRNTVHSIKDVLTFTWEK